MFPSILFVFLCVSVVENFLSNTQVKIGKKAKGARQQGRKREGRRQRQPAVEVLSNELSCFLPRAFCLLA
jgi:hypothetical protein